jgi:DNA-binding Lrp family transcriptional regulator
MSLSELEREFINHYQGNFPLKERPFETIAERLNCAEDELIGTVKHLKDENLLTRFGPLYDAASLGGGLTLAAIAVPEERYAIVTEIVNSYPQVAHNYRREHGLNMWFVVATETPEEIDSILQAIEQATELKVYNFPKQHEFYIGLWLQLSADGRHTTVPVPTTDFEEGTACILDDIDRKLISVTQSGIAIERSPYQSIADNIGSTQQDVLQRFQKMLSCGIIRRIGAVPNHYRLGLTANGMTVWDVDDDRVIELGNIIGRLDFVSHCYQRPRHLPVWRYNLFAMVHGHDRDEVKTKVEQIKNLLGDHCREHETLFSSAILKKTGLRLAA